MGKEVGQRQQDTIGFMDFPRDVTGQTRETAYDAYNTLARAKVKAIGLNFEASDYLNSTGIGLVISLVGLNERIILVSNETEMIDKCREF